MPVFLNITLININILPFIESIECFNVGLSTTVLQGYCASPYRYISYRIILAHFAGQKRILA